ncbi:MAG: hypothetical protein LQ350_002418 [Teloschistes chrysophthalmus]|nr:MAG: hypothetical protein LQ350_002418 [Niorma chrysophthalma]
MRRVKIFSGSSHPCLVDAICERLGTQPAKCELKKFSNGETSVSIGTSIRDQDVFIVQSGSEKINDGLMELLVMISACKGGSAKSITAVMPYFPYSRQSKKKSHRGAIAARLVANLLSVAGINHAITVDLHAPPTQGFFGKPVDNLHAEPLIARWIRNHVAGWKEAVVVSKNPGGSKRVTSLADALKLNFGIITTDRRRTTNGGSSILDTSGYLDRMGDGTYDINHLRRSETEVEASIDPTVDVEQPREITRRSPRSSGQANGQINGPRSSLPIPFRTQPSPTAAPRNQIPRSTPSDDRPTSSDSAEEDYTDERAREVITGRLIQGHLVDDDHPSPILSTMSGSVTTLPAGDATTIGPSHFPSEDQDPMTSSFMSHISTAPSINTLAGGSVAEGESDDEEGFQNPELEHTITLVGNVKDRTVFIMDDLIDQCGSWIAAAETVVKRGGAKRVYCIATHGLFGYDSLEQMEECECIDFIVVTNTYPISQKRVRASRKLVVLDVSNLLSEAIRRNHYGESISPLFQHYAD